MQSHCVMILLVAVSLLTDIDLVLNVISDHWELVHPN